MLNWNLTLFFYQRYAKKHYILNGVICVRINIDRNDGLFLVTDWVKSHSVIFFLIRQTCRPLLTSI